MAASSLTPDQQEADAAFSRWLEAPWDGQPFVLCGYAGTGKTFLSMQLLAQVEARARCWTVVAPTHKAVGVLRQHLERAALQPTWFPSTLHRLLRLKLRRQGGRETCHETAQTAGSLENLHLVLVDEASMVDSTLLEITLRCAHPFRTRLVFVGDPAQLPPVGEAISPVFALSRAWRVDLRQVVRHQGPVLRLASGIREQILPCRRPPPLGTIRREGGLVALLERQTWLHQAQEALRRSAASGDPDRARILCYTNRSLEQLVPIARRALHGSMADQVPVLPGEVLITREAVLAPACRQGAEAGEEPDLVLGSNREVLVIDVRPERVDLAELGLEAADLVEGASLLPGGVPVIDTLSVRVDAGAQELELRLLPPLGSKDRQQLEAVLEQLRQAARQVEGKAGKALWRRFFLLRDAFASLGPAAVLTVHRSQGSTFAEVFVDADVFWPRDLVLRRQLVYVAVSRASQAVSLVAASSGAGPEERQLWRDWLEDDESRVEADSETEARGHAAAEPRPEEPRPEEPRPEEPTAKGDVLSEPHRPPPPR